MPKRHMHLLPLLLILPVMLAGCRGATPDAEIDNQNVSEEIAPKSLLDADPTRRSVDQMPDITNGTGEIIPEYERRTPVMPDEDDAGESPLTPELFTPDGAAGTPPGASFDRDPQPDDMTLEEEVVAILNGLRIEAGLDPLEMDSRLSDLARRKSADMALNGYFSHDSPTLGSVEDLLRSGGIAYGAAGENIAYGRRDADSVVADWYASEGHRLNMLSERYTNVGVGLAVSENGTYYWTQIFTG